mmetsp:Transcript_42034/g.104953  ORF Transcript_42034/g.104953 Transcript_42034/m.104953 type:complete len:339 (-) Transcript_42034:206-1222(-)
MVCVRTSCCLRALWPTRSSTGCCSSSPLTRSCWARWSWPTSPPPSPTCSTTRVSGARRTSHPRSSRPSHSPASPAPLPPMTRWMGLGRLPHSSAPSCPSPSSRGGSRPIRTGRPSSRPGHTTSLHRCRRKCGGLCTSTRPSTTHPCRPPLQTPWRGLRTVRHWSTARRSRLTGCRRSCWPLPRWTPSTSPHPSSPPPSTDAHRPSSGQRARHTNSATSASSRPSEHSFLWGPSRVPTSGRTGTKAKGTRRTAGSWPRGGRCRHSAAWTASPRRSWRSWSTYSRAHWPHSKPARGTGAEAAVVQTRRRESPRMQSTMPLMSTSGRDHAHVLTDPFVCPD